MWGAAWAGAGAGLAAALLLLLLCRRRKPAPRPPRPPRLSAPVQVQRVVLAAARGRLPAREGAPLARAPPPPRAAPPPPPPCLTPPAWLQRPLVPSYAAAFAHMVPTHLGVGLPREARSAKFGAARSPSLEKDDKSPLAARPPDAAGMEPPRPPAPAPVPAPSPARARFDFSPKVVGDSVSSPRFFTPPETASPMFFAEASPRSVYYDSVRSPKFFAESPREPELLHSPRALGEHSNRSNGVADKPSSPRPLGARPSPKVLSRNKENYFSFDHVGVVDETAFRLSPKPRKYGGRSSLEKERYTPPVDKDVKKYRRHNSCDTSYKSVELNVTKCEDNKNVASKEKDSLQTIDSVDKDVVDCCAKVESLDLDSELSVEKNELTVSNPNSAQIRRQRLKSISLDSENAKIIEQNLGIPVAKQMKDQMNEAYRNQELSTSCESIERFPKSPSTERPSFKFEDDEQLGKDSVEPKSPAEVIQVKLKKSLRQSSDTQSFLDMPRFSPKEFEITVTSEEGTTSIEEAQAKKKGKNLRNLTIDLTKRDSELEKELLEFEKLYTDAEEKKVKTPTLKVKATSLDSSETVNLSLPQKKALDVPQNSVSVPNTPKRQMKRILAQKTMKHDKMGYSGLQCGPDQRRLYMKGQDSGIFLRENHAALMLYQPGGSRLGSRNMGSFDENYADSDPTPGISVSGAGHRPGETAQTLGANLLNYKQNLSVSSTNLKTLPEGVPSDDFELSAEDEKLSKKLHRRNSNQSLMHSTHSLQSSNCSLNSAGASCHNLATVRTSLSNFSLNSDGRQNRLSLDRRDSYTAPNVNEHLTPTTRVIYSSNTNLSGEVAKNCLLQRRGSNNSLTLNLCSSNNLSRYSSNSSLHKEAKPAQKKGLLERRSSNTSLTLNINTSNPQLSVNRGLSISNYNLNGSSCNLSRYNSNQSIDNAAVEHKKGILERRSSNTSLTLNIQPQEPRDVDIDDSLIDPAISHRDKHRKSLSTENLIPKSYKNRTKFRASDKCLAFGSHDNLWSSSYRSEREGCALTCVGGDHEDEIIYALARAGPADPADATDPADPADPAARGFVRNISTRPLSPQSTSEDFRAYLANMQHLQTASSVLTRARLRDLRRLFTEGYSTVRCGTGGPSGPSGTGGPCCSGQVPDPAGGPPRPCADYQKALVRALHQEFWDMPTNLQEKPLVSGSHAKNRYRSILPNEHSRVILHAEPGRPPGYINANYIKGHEYTKSRYIATQAPLPNTIYDFWRMVRQAGAARVVMLTDLVEGGRSKCELYFPLRARTRLEFRDPERPGAGAVEVAHAGAVRRGHYSVRRLRVRAGGGPPATVLHYWFHGWPDHACPADVAALLDFCLDVLTEPAFEFDADESGGGGGGGGDDLGAAGGAAGDEAARGAGAAADGPGGGWGRWARGAAVVHCSAGVGRAGALLAALAGVRSLHSERRADVLGAVCSLRLCRGGAVQTSEQYELVHRLLAEYERRLPPEDADSSR